MLIAEVRYRANMPMVWLERAGTILAAPGAPIQPPKVRSPSRHTKHPPPPRTTIWA